MKIFSELRSLYEEKEQNNLVIFVGAGISENYANINGGTGFPSWQTLIDAMVAEDMQHKNDVDFLKTAQIFQDNNSKEALVNKVKELFPKDYDFHEIHKLIFDLEPEHILTTNYDSLLEKAMRYKNLDIKYHIVDSDEKIPLSKSKQNLLVKAHGDLHRGNIVLSEQDYNEYDKNFPLILSFIRYVFSKYKVLFIGFSLSDPNFNKILYWVKNILDENSIKHSVILHDDISESERIHFEKKSVKVLTKDEIVSEVLANTEDENNYLIEALNFIKKGFPSQNYTSMQRLDVLKKDLKRMKYFEYFTPELISAFLEGVYLEFYYYEVAESLEKNNEKTICFPWISNIIQKDSYTNPKDELNIFSLIKKEMDNIESDIDFQENYFQDIAKLILSTNISSIGYMHSSIEQKDILELLQQTDIENKNLQYLLTYKHKIDGSTGLFNGYDKSFKKESPYYNQLIFSDESYFTDYMLGDNAQAYKKCESSILNDSIDKYLQYFRLHFLRTKDDGDSDSYKMSNDLYNLMDKYNQKLFKNIHHLGFVQTFLDYILTLEKNYEELLKSDPKFLGGWNKKVLYRVSFYINYSRFLKFIILNKFPVFREEQVNKAINLANKLYFKYFFEVEEDEIGLSNWIILGIALDAKSSDIRESTIEFFNNPANKKYAICFDKKYIKDLFLENIANKNIEESLINFKNLFYVLALSTKDRENYIFILSLFYELIQFDIKNIEHFSEAFHMAYLHYSKENTIDDEIKDSLEKTLELYLEYKVDYTRNKDIVVDDLFAHFIDSIYDMKLNFKNSNKTILQLLKTDREDITCKNITELIYLFKILGYSYKDIEKVVIHIQNKFEKEDFFDRTDRIKYPLEQDTEEIQNAIIAIYKAYKKNLGVEKIEDHHINTGYSREPVEWLILLIDKGITSKDFDKKIDISKYKDALESSFKHLCLQRKFDFKKGTRHVLVEFLIKTNNIQIILSIFHVLKFDDNISAYIDLFTFLINNKSILKDYKSELIKLLELLENSSYKSIFLSTKLILLNHKNISDDELKKILIKILSKDIYE